MMADDREARIRDTAYRLWQQDGEQHGRDRDHWERAEREIGDGDAAPEAPAAQPDEPVAAPEIEAIPPDVTEQPAVPAAPAPQAPKAAAKKPATRRKRTT